MTDKEQTTEAPLCITRGGKLVAFDMFVSPLSDKEFIIARSGATHCRNSLCEPIPKNKGENGEHKNPAIQDN